MRKILFVLISFVLINQAHELCAHKTRLVAICNTIRRSIPTMNYGWNTGNAQPLHVHGESEHKDVHGPSVLNLQNKIYKYVQHDESLQELHLKLRSYTENIKKHNIDDSELEFDTVVLPQTTVSAMNQYVDAIIAHKNTDFSWQIKEYGPIRGAFSCVKNLCVPHNMQTYLGAGLTFVGLQVLLRSVSTPTPNITVNVPTEAQLTMYNNSFASYNITKGVAICSLVAGTIVAGMQWYTSLTSRQHSKDQLDLWIQQLQNHNLGMANYNVNKKTNGIVNQILSQNDNTRCVIDENQRVNGQEFLNLRNGIHGVDTKISDHYKKYVDWLVQDAEDKSKVSKIMKSIEKRLTSASDRQVIDNNKVQHQLHSIRTHQDNHGILLRQIIDTQLQGNTDSESIDY
ncbi:MAG: hypothetical protein Q8Q60_03000 [Candidatus Chromulinivorax sp.]|nr:hypothetical protein [Candidatus Chromulinivorax sp.]